MRGHKEGLRCVHAMNSHVQGRRVLLAEDNLINQKVAQMMLTSLGMVVELASNGQEAMDAILKSSKAATQFHCVLMDMAMPVMGGVDATLVSIFLHQIAGENLNLLDDLHRRCNFQF